MNLRLQLAIDYYVGTALHVLLKPLVVLLGKILHRRHDLSECRTVTVIKMLGGGSLTIAYPALVAIKRAAPHRRLLLLTTPSVRPFGEALGIFDEIIVINTQSIPRLLFDSLGAIRRLFCCDAIVDLEIHSRLTTVFALMTCARNRIGFYTRDSYWRQYLSTHLLFCNIKNGIYNFYDQAAELFGAHVDDFAVYQRAFRDFIGVHGSVEMDAGLKLAVAPCVSELSKERMLRTEDWAEVIGRRVPPGVDEENVVALLFGAPQDRPALDHLRQMLAGAFPRMTIVNRAGATTLLEAVREMAQANELLCVDSALLHYARLMGLRTVSFWGPTDPASLLRPWPGGGDEIHYSGLTCSPCVHLTDLPPCGGNNICMRLAVDPTLPIGRNPAWIINHDVASRFRRPSAP